MGMILPVFRRSGTCPEQKKDAPRDAPTTTGSIDPSTSNAAQVEYAMVDLPVPAIPDSQKIGGADGSTALSRICAKTASRVPELQALRGGAP